MRVYPDEGRNVIFLPLPGVARIVGSKLSNIIRQVKLYVIAFEKRGFLTQF